MDNIRQSLEPIITAFIKGLDSLEHKYTERQKDLEVEISLSKKINLSMKKEQKRIHDLNQEKS